MDSLVAQPLHIPPFYCPIPPARHPEITTIDERSIRWFQSFGLFAGQRGLEILRGWHHAELAARAYPHEDPGKVQIMADFVHWTIIDDAIIDDVRVGDPPGGQAPAPPLSQRAPMQLGQLLPLAGKMVRMLEVPEAALLQNLPWFNALMDVRLRVGAIATPVQIARWIAAFREYLLAAAWKRSCQLAHHMPSLADYVTMRTPDGGVQMYVTLSEVIGGYQLPADELVQPNVRALTEMALTLVAWDNDLFSHYKETLTESPCINLINVIAVERGCPLQDAVPAATAMRDRVMCQYMRIRERPDPSLSEQTCLYLSSLDRWIAANIDMSANSTRYLNPLNQQRNQMPWADFTPTRTDTPTDSTPTPYRSPISPGGGKSKSPVELTARQGDQP